MNARISTAEGATRTRSMRRPSGSRRALALISAGAMVGLGASLTVPAAASPEHGSRGFRQINLVSDQPGVAPLRDPDLVNAWGLSASPGTDAAPGSPLWVSDNGTDKTTLYAGASATSVSKFLAIDVASGTPTGQVFNTDPTGFVIHDAAGNSGPARFIFDSESGGIDGWNPTVGATGPAPSTVTEVAVKQRRERGVQGPGDRHGLGRAHLPVRRQLPLRARRGLRRHLHPGRATRRTVRRSADPGRVCAVQRPGAGRQAVRHLREAGRHPARRRRGSVAMVSSTSSPTTVRSSSGS